MKTEGRKIDFVGQLIAESTVFFVRNHPQFHFYTFFEIKIHLIFANSNINNIILSTIKIFNSFSNMVKISIKGDNMSNSNLKKLS